MERFGGDACACSSDTFTSLVSSEPKSPSGFAKPTPTAHVADMRHAYLDPDTAEIAEAVEIKRGEVSTCAPLLPVHLVFVGADGSRRLGVLGFAQIFYRERAEQRRLQEADRKREQKAIRETQLEVVSMQSMIRQYVP